MVFDLLTLTSIARGHLLEKQHVRCGSLCWFWFDSFRHVPTCLILWFLFRNLQAGGASSTFSLAPTKTLNDTGDITADHRDVPAKFVMKQCCGWFSFSFFKAVASNFRPFSVACPTQFRCFSDSLSIRFDTCPIQFRSGFDACPFHFQSPFTRPPLWRTTGWTT